MLAVVRRNGKIVYLGEPGHIRRTRAFTWRKFRVRGGLVWVCFGHSQSDPFQHRLHVSALTGGLQLSHAYLYFVLPWAFKSMCLLPPAPLLSLPCCCGIVLLACLPFRRAAGICWGREEHRWRDAMGGLPVVPASSPQGFKAAQALERCIAGTQACWCWVLCETSLPLPEAQLSERLPATLLPQRVFWVLYFI